MSHIRESKKEEEKTIEAIDKNPKYFYWYTKLKALIKASIEPLKKMNASENLVTDNAERCKILGEQYVPAYSASQTTLT